MRYAFAPVVYAVEKQSIDFYLLLFVYIVQYSKLTGRAASLLPNTRRAMEGEIIWIQVRISSTDCFYHISMMVMIIRTIGAANKIESKRSNIPP